LVADFLGNVDIQGKLFYSSDARIKKDKSPTDNAADLDLLKKIEITNYRYIDGNKYGTTPQKKVIAQQVETVYPQAVTAIKDFIPNIYAMSGPVSKNGNLLTVDLSNCTDVRAGDKIRLYDGSTVREVYVIAVDDHDLVLDYPFEAPTSAVFLYGTEVNDFRQVDYEAISMLNVSATQALAKELEDTKSKLAQANDENQRMHDLTGQHDILIKSMKAQIDAISEKLNITVAK
jgi:hypothetical protein